MIQYSRYAAGKKGLKALIYAYFSYRCTHVSKEALHFLRINSVPTKCWEANEQMMIIYIKYDLCFSFCI